MATGWVRLLAEDSGFLGGQVGWDFKAASCLQQLFLWSNCILKACPDAACCQAYWAAVGSAATIHLQPFMYGSDGIINPALWLNPPYCIKGWWHSIFLKRRYWFLTLATSTKARLGVAGRGQAPNNLHEPGCHQGIFFSTGALQEEDLPQVIIFPLPFRRALTNFKDCIMKKAFKTHTNHIALESANAYGALCWLEQQAGGWLLYHLSVVWLCEWEIQRQLYNLKFRLP